MTKKLFFSVLFVGAIFIFESMIEIVVGVENLTSSETHQENTILAFSQWLVISGMKNIFFLSIAYTFFWKRFIPVRPSLDHFQSTDLWSTYKISLFFLLYTIFTILWFTIGTLNAIGDNEHDTQVWVMTVVALIFTFFQFIFGCSCFFHIK